MKRQNTLVYFELDFYFYCNEIANGAMLLLLLACRCRRAEVAVIGCGFWLLRPSLHLESLRYPGRIDHFLAIFQRI